LAKFSIEEKNHSNLHYKKFQKILKLFVVQMTQIVWKKALVMTTGGET
jgi:hypothetical protein